MVVVGRLLGVDNLFWTTQAGLSSHHKHHLSFVGLATHPRQEGMPGSHLLPKTSVPSQLLTGLLFGTRDMGSKGEFQLSLAPFTASGDGG